MEENVSRKLKRRSELDDRDRIVIITRRKRQVTTSLLPSSSFVILNVTAAVVESMRALTPPPLPPPPQPLVFHAFTQAACHSLPILSRHFPFSRDLTSSGRFISSFSIPHIVSYVFVRMLATFNIVARLHRGKGKVKVYFFRRKMASTKFFFSL